MKRKALSNLFTPAQAARLPSISAQRLWQLITDGKLPRVNQDGLGQIAKGKNPKRHEVA
jgi:hypothetical protein